MGKRVMTTMIGLTVLLTPMAGVAQKKSSDVHDAEHIVTQPARDVGIDKKKVPPLLQAAVEDPYSRASTGSCAQISSAVRALNNILGPDFGNDSAGGGKANIAKIGGAAVVNSLIPFRGVVRAVSGAEAADQRYAAAVTAGIARRGYLRGLFEGKNCRGRL
jgi:hypothetical protein